MSDPIDEIFNGTPDGIDEDELKQMQQEEMVIDEMADYETPAATPSPTTTESQPQQETKPTATAEEPKKEEGGFDIGEGLRDLSLIHI